MGAIVAGLAACPSVPGRFEVLHDDPVVVVDFAHTPDALARTCDTARGLTKGRLIVVMGAGGDRDRDKRGPMGKEFVVKAKVDSSLCEGHAKCMENAPEVFEVRDDDQSHVLIDDIPEELRAKVERAARICPRAAISIEE